MKKLFAVFLLVLFSCGHFDVKVGSISDPFKDGGVTADTLKRERWR